MPPEALALVFDGWLRRFSTACCPVLQLLRHLELEIVTLHLKVRDLLPQLQDLELNLRHDVWDSRLAPQLDPECGRGF